MIVIEWAIQKKYQRAKYLLIMFDPTLFDKDYISNRN